VGIYSSISDGAKNLVKWDKEFIPNPANKPIYDEAKTNWQNAYSKMLQLVNEKAVAPMWKAPGL
jgi:autoinducer 2 (AI-2) kinase